MIGISWRNTSLRRHNDVFCHEIRVIAPHMPSQKSTILILCSFVFSPLRIYSLFSRLKPLNFDYILVMWREIWISLITCNSASFCPIEMGFLPEIIEFYAQNYHQVFTISFLNFLSNAKFGHHIWRHSSSPIGWKKTPIKR